ncbi:hypothetical protein DPMN_025136 [Dreissena polymorpha]|uniref:Uncharacterized protein n=1 Tax=Dreissena polymorpha TaxID=45954 RepID=A0A9D4RDB8_DREPO|nr:hypothetical protein DPMN_025136 [Dreissena polymorpha]
MTCKLALTRMSTTDDVQAGADSHMYTEDDVQAGGHCYSFKIQKYKNPGSYLHTL